MSSKKKCILYLFLLIAFNSCITAGTHGSIKGYQYPVSKYTLEKAVQEVISTNQNIRRDTAKAYYDSTKSDYYNDGHNYVTITIIKNNIVNSYTFKYGGNKDYWDTSKVSSISICYAFDKDANGGSEGDGGFPWYKFELKKKLIAVFESEFIYKIDTLLNQKHLDID